MVLTFNDKIIIDINYNCCNMVHISWHINIHWGHCIRYLYNLYISYVIRLTSNNTECSLSHFLTICNFTEANKCSNCPNVYLWLIPLPLYNNNFSPFPKVTVFPTLSEICILFIGIVVPYIYIKPLFVCIHI